MSWSYDQVPSGLIFTVMFHASVVKARSMNGFDTMPFTRLPRSALSVNCVSPGFTRPLAMATCPRGMASVWNTVPVAGSHSQ
ncbi:hypothetical protein D9M68_604570 [compost metagenome]